MKVSILNIYCKTISTNNKFKLDTTLFEFLSFLHLEKALDLTKFYFVTIKAYHSTTNSQLKWIHIQYTQGGLSENVLGDLFSDC